MKRASFLISMTLLLSIVVYGQVPAPSPAAPSAAPPQATAAPPRAPAQVAVVPTGGKSFAVIDFMAALTENVDGKKASERLAAESAKLQKILQDKNKEGTDLQTKLTTDKTLTDAQKADMTKKIEQIGTELTRDQEDFQKQIQDMQQQLLAPIADKVKKEVTAYATENSFAVVMDNSGQQDNIIYSSPVADITTEIIRRLDAAAAKAPSAPMRSPATTTAPRPTPPAGAPAAPSRSPAPATKAPPEASK